MTISVPAARPRVGSSRGVRPFLQALPREPSLKYWWRFDAERLTVVNTNQVSTARDILTQAQGASNSDGHRPVLAPGAINGRHGLNFNGVADYLVFSALTGSGIFAGSFTIAMILQVAAAPTDATRYVLSDFQEVSNPGSMIQLRTNGKIRVEHGSGPEGAWLEAPLRLGEPLLVMLGVRDKYVRGRFCGADMLSASGKPVAITDNAHGAQSLVMGAINNIGPAYSDGNFFATDLFVYDDEIITQGPIMRGVERYFSRRFDGYLDYQS